MRERPTVGRLIMLALCLLWLPFAVDAQLGSHVRRIGVLTLTTPPSEDAIRQSPLAPSEDAIRQSPFWHAMHTLGWRVGQNITIERRDADGHVERLPAYAVDLVRLGVDVIIARGTQATQAAMHATTTIPIVMSFTAFAVENGLVASLARPGGNVTGITFSDLELLGKQLELLKEALPTLTHLGLLRDPENPTSDILLRGMQDAARALSITLHLLDIPGSSGTIAQLVALLTQERLDALWVGANAFASQHQQAIADLAVQQRLPMFGPQGFVERGGLMAYEETARDRAPRVAAYVDRILKGAKPAELPIERPRRFQLVLNLKTAQILGLTIPASLLVQADKVIK